MRFLQKSESSKKALREVGFYS